VLVSESERQHFHALTNVLAEQFVVWWKLILDVTRIEIQSALTHFVTKMSASKMTADRLWNAVRRIFATN
jgi:hypothetical protein